MPRYLPLNPISDADLEPYGYIPGACGRWCVGCGRVKLGMATNAFKCRQCAADQFRAVERAADKVRG